MAHRFSEAELGVVREIFLHVDTDGDGAISTKELRTALHSLQDVAFSFREEFTDDKLDAMIKKIDTDGDGKVSYEEFVKMLEEK